MEAQIGGRFYGNGASEKGLMQSREWDLNDWKWDANLFIASPLNSIPADCRNKPLFPAGSGIPAGFSGNGGRCNGWSSSCLEEINGDTGKAKGESEKRRRVLMVEEDELNDEEAGSLTLKLGEHVYPVLETMDLASWDGKNGKKMKLQVSSLNRSICQVENCGADLTGAKDYHKRHKVCEMHSKASKALVGNVMQRFCQQCSRFHVLQEFDEGKRSCRRRLAGHNRRRRKTHPDSIVSGNPLNDERASGYLLISLLRILSNLHSNSSEVTKNQDLLSHLLRNLASFAGTFDGTGLSRLLQTSQDMQSIGPSVAASSDKVQTLLSNAVNCVTAQEPSRPTLVGMPGKGLVTDNFACETLQTVPTQDFNGLPGKAKPSCSLEPMLHQGSTVERAKLNNFDLNNIYYESQDCVVETGSLGCPWLIHDSNQSSPPQTSGNSDSASAESPSSSNGDFQSRTDRIVFKLFGKDPSDFPLVLRGQILDWLSHSPTDIESYIRPGCIVLTIYLRLAESTWEELCCGLRSSLKRLLDISDDVFWRSGWIYARVQHRIAFMYNGQVVLDSPLHWRSQHHSKILSVTPIAVPISEKANFTVKGFNLSRSTTKLLCAFEGKYLVQETSDLGTDMFKDYQHFQTLSFSCTLPNLTGRGFIEVEDHNLSTGFFPFIVAEQDICTEIRVLESLIEEVMESDEEIRKKTEKSRAKNQALEFLQEMGWLLQRSCLYKSRLNGSDSCLSVFPNARFKWLLEFSMDRDWCAVVKKLLDILFDGNVDVGPHSSVDLMLSEMGLLHGATRRKSRPMVEFLLRYAPDRNTSEKTTTQQNQRGQEKFGYFMFRPDEIGPAGVAPLHIAASCDGAGDVLDALTDDPRLVGIEAWKNAKDKTGFTPEDYARLRGYNHYIQLVQKKIDNKSAAGHVILDIRGLLAHKTQTQTGPLTKETSSELFKLPGLQIDRRRAKPIEQNCSLCDQQLRNRKINGSLLYRPAVLSMVTIAAVCVCVALIFKGPPEVDFVFPFRWELLGYGPI